MLGYFLVYLLNIAVNCGEECLHFCSYLSGSLGCEAVVFIGAFAAEGRHAENQVGVLVVCLNTGGQLEEELLCFVVDECGVGVVIIYIEIIAEEYSCGNRVFRAANESPAAEKSRCVSLCFAVILRNVGEAYIIRVHLREIACSLKTVSVGNSNTCLALYEVLQQVALKRIFNKTGAYPL